MKLSQRIVTSAGATLGAIVVSVKRPGSEQTYPTTGAVRRVSQNGETFYAWRVGNDHGTNAKYTGAVLVAGQHIERAEARP